MRPEFFKIIPPEITTNILSRLSVRSVAISKCVCKPWLHLLETDHFIKSHFAKSTPALAFSLGTRDSNWFYVSQLEEHGLVLGRRYDPLTRFDFSPKAKLWGYASDSLTLRSSANGLLLLHNNDGGKSTFYVCNPITREFIMLCCAYRNTFGFGVSRISGQYKVLSVDDKKRWYVYTLGTGSWRCLEATDSLDSSVIGVGLFVHGNLHWMVNSDRDPFEWISCFDLETERLSRFTIPPRRSNASIRLYTLRDSLSFCDKSPDGGGIAIWMMEEYGEEKSWTMEYAITLNLGRNLVIEGLDEFQFVFPMQVFKNGDVLMLDGKRFMYYSKKTKTIQEIGGFFDAGVEEFYDIDSMPVTPSMVSLKCFSEMEHVISF